MIYSLCKLMQMISVCHQEKSALLTPSFFNSKYFCGNMSNNIIFLSYFFKHVHTIFPTAHLAKSRVCTL